MKSLWIIVSTLALANLVAVLAFVGWLVSGERLNMERVYAIRDMLRETIPEEQARLAVEMQAVADEQQRQEILSRIGTPPTGVSQRMRIIQEHTAAQTLREQRFERHSRNLLTDLYRREEAFDAERARFTLEKQQWEAMRDEIVALEGDAQFQQAVGLYGTLKPKQAKAMMLALLEEGQFLRVVAYLDAMPSRKASKVVSEFEKTDPRLAADLLERLRTLGVEPQATEDVADE